MGTSKCLPPVRVVEGEVIEVVTAMRCTTVPDSKVLKGRYVS